MVPVLLLFYPVSQTLLFVGIIHWFGNVWKFIIFGEAANWRLIALFSLPGSVATYIGARLVFLTPETIIARSIGAFLILYALYLLVKPAFKIRKTPTTAILGGTLSGFVAGASGVGGALRSAFLAAFNLPKEVYIVTSGAMAFAIDSVRLITYTASGARIETTLLVGLAIFIPLSFIGAKAAQLVVDRIPQNHFRLVVAVFIMLIGVRLAILPS